MKPLSRLSVLALATLSVLGLAGCSSGPVSGPAYVYDAYDLSVLNGPAANGGMAAYLSGEPFPGQEAALKRVVDRVLTDHRFGARFPVTTDPSPALKKAAYKVVLVFDPPVKWDEYAVCKNGELPKSMGRQGEGITVLAIFCEGFRRMTSTQGYVPAATSPDDPRFVALMKQITLDLFPPIRPTGDRNSNIELSALSGAGAF
ncbi:hypothetical protein SAMN06265365_108107 [Tistlia consotensis]|uniref:DUF4136 domain-containing protein n=1 Tax=Tistlia consotensis USBA 355 TaxID=560819 RepID=A0A1Y6BY78_9PROT|nr:hypothetical protein [Tistlia consotensis]SMF24261.1 hypothetical protein SAMN05428998_10873 [Tistlia consotensis USBA 355]SNR60804.1 hypothetical protein SAMN06265365_108107 [Tistlia consotensis]